MKQKQNKQKKCEKLLEKQMKALGNQPPKQIWNSELKPLFEDISGNSNISEIQTFDYFQDMGKREPNSKGSGRFLINDSRKIIGLLQVGCEKSLHKIKLWLECYFCLQVQILESSLVLKKSKKNYSLIDPKKQLEFPLKSLKRKIDAFTLMDVLVEYVPKNVYSLVAIINNEIFDPEEPENSILGRACGDRVCVVQDDPDIKQFYGTIAHELMHTIGLDHCELWKCIMNPMIGDLLQLCPLDLRKLQSAINFDVAERYQKSQSWSKEEIWVQLILDAINKE